MGIRQLTHNDWELYRNIRLESLLADPSAFASTHEREAAFDEVLWRGRLSSGPDGRPVGVFLDEVSDGVDASSDDAPLGTASIVYTEHHAAPMLAAMWVRPTARGSGSARRLVEATCAWAEARGETAVVLWVVRDNEPAIRLYESCGFTPTGTTDVLPSNPCAEELEMLRLLGESAATTTAQSHS